VIAIMPDDVSRAAAAPLQTDKKPKAFRITTALGVGIGTDEKDPLLLAQINGSESVSAPYSFELTVLQRKKTDDGSPRPAVDPKDLLNTDVTFGISSTENDGQFFDWIERHGTIDHFEELADSPSDATGDGFRCYAMRVVPRFRLLEREKTFRIFENMDVLSVIRSVFRAQGDIPADYLILRLDPDTKFTPMPYCVQFGEDSLTFVSRLMATFGLWYFFFHDHERDTEQMILGRGRFRPRGEPALLFRSDAPEQKQVSGYRRIFSTAPKRVNVGEFNPLDPTNPFQGSEKIADRYDIAVKNNVHTPGRFQHRIFPGSFLSNEELRTEAKQRMESGEAAVFTATGQSKNRRLRAGGGVIVETEKSNDVDRHKLVVTTLSIHGIDLNFGLGVRNIGEFLKVLFKGLNPFGDEKITTISATIAQNETGEYLLKGASTLANAASTIGSVVPVVNFVYKLPDAITSVVSGASSAADTANKVLGGPHGGVDFGNNFVGVSEDIITDDTVLLPLPLAQKPVARGPHPAVVIGRDGAKANGGSEVFADGLGRVRVRFPWEPPDESGDPLAKPPFQSGANSAWLRVSEGWAGHGWGTQFLPRIGQEVLVDFLDGDPERPIIVGRLYNADSGFANIPFPEGQVDAEQVEQKDLADPTPFTDYRFTGLKTSSTPKPSPSAKDRYHLTRFDDTFNCEQYLIRSQGRLDVTAFAHSFETTYGNRHVKVVPGKDKDGKSFGGAAFTTVGGEYDLHVGDNRYEGVDKGYQLSIKTDTIFDLQANHKSIVGSDSTLNAKNVVIEAPIKITLKVGSSFVVVDNAGVWIKGPVVMINSGGSPGATSDVDVTDAADAATAEPGDQANKRLTTCDPHPPGGGGGRRHHTATAKHGLEVTFNPADQSFSVGPHGRVKVDGKDKKFADDTITDLATIDQTPNGHALLGRLDTSGHTTTIQPQNPIADGGTSWTNPGGSRPGAPGTVDAAGNPIPGAGSGSDATVSYSPSFYPANKTNEPGDVALYHELTHADHATHGTIDKTPRADDYDDQEEFNTIQEENQYRNQRGPWPGMPGPPNNLRTNHTDA
jgi:uncharacterized protein involved in type VI secretion and phage assembly